MSEDTVHRHDRGKEIRLQTIMIGASLCILGFFAVKVISQGETVAGIIATQNLIIKEHEGLNQRVRVLEITGGNHHNGSVTIP